MIVRQCGFGRGAFLQLQLFPSKIFQCPLIFGNFGKKICFMFSVLFNSFKFQCLETRFSKRVFCFYSAIALTGCDPAETKGNLEFLLLQLPKDIRYSMPSDLSEVMTLKLKSPYLHFSAKFTILTNLMHSFENEEVSSFL